MEACFNTAVRMMRSDDICLTWHYKQGDIGVLNKKEMNAQVELWNKMNKETMRVEHYNNNTFEVNGRKWFVMVVQLHNLDGTPNEEKNHICPLSSMIFGTLVSGFTYAFRYGKDRDDYTYFVNHKENPLSRNPTCCLCGEKCENEYGNNPSPLEQAPKRCCDKCNGKVIKARIEYYKKEIIEEEEKKASKVREEILKGETKVEVKHKKKHNKKEDQAEQTRNANKKQQEEKQRRLEYERRVAECAKLAQQQKKKGKR